MTVSSSNIVNLAPAVDLILQPLVLEVLVAIDEGKALEDALSADTDEALLTAAVQRLVAIGAVRPSVAGPFGFHQLTARGRDLLRLVEGLDAWVTTRETVTTTN